jgi:hypothetical protein
MGIGGPELYWEYYGVVSGFGVCLIIDLELVWIRGI